MLFAYIQSISTALRGGYIRFWSQYIEQLPIRLPNLDDPAEQGYHDRIVLHVEKMIALHKQLAVVKSTHDRTFLQRQIDQADHQIDRLVYTLYDLTPEEIDLIERASDASVA